MDHGRDTDTQEGPGDHITISVFKNVIMCFRAGMESIYTKTFGKVDGYLTRKNDID